VPSRKGARFAARPFLGGGPPRQAASVENTTFKPEGWARLQRRTFPGAPRAAPRNPLTFFPGDGERGRSKRALSPPSAAPSPGGGGAGGSGVGGGGAVGAPVVVRSVREIEDSMGQAPKLSKRQSKPPSDLPRG
jgi:hypothetical protein